jgi:exodeoxyribonuclease V alpha subunit
MQDEMVGFIDSIVFLNEENGYTIAQIKIPNQKELVTIVGMLPGVLIGETIQSQGMWKKHPKFGLQFEVSSFKTQAPIEANGIQKYLESGMIKGIGATYAKRIVAKFGSNTLNVIDEKPEKLLLVPGIGEKRVQTIIKCWTEQRGVRNVMIFLRGHGVSSSFAQKIYKTYGNESISKMRENPYRIAQEVRGMGFKSADQIAQNLGIAQDAPQRIQSGIQHALWELSTDGHLCYPKEQLISICHEMLGVEGVHQELHALEQQQVIVVEEGFVWIKPLFLAELGIAREMKRLMEAPCSLRGVKTEKALEWVEKKLHLQLALEQKVAVATAFEEKIMILTGGPGTGKSTITNAILRITEKLTDKILLAAPTGRAAKRMSEITRRRASTIHSLLKIDFTKGGFKKNHDNPLKCDLLIVDEASMIDTSLMYHLLKAIFKTCRVIFVGDIDQLPSVGPGNVLRDLIDSETLPIVRLREIFRQAKGSHIITNAHKINQGEFPYLNGKRDFRFIEAEKPEDVRRSIITLLTLELNEFDVKKQVQVLCPMKRGIIGIDSLNEELQRLLNPNRCQPLVRMGRRFLTGDKVMQIRNQHNKKLSNGDVGYITAIDPSDQFLKVDFYGHEVIYDISELDELVLAYAVSIHKYQGSECPCVIIPIHTTHFKLLHRNLLYTGITRGKKRVYLVGTKKAIAIAIHNEEVKLRYTGLKRQMLQFLGQQMSRFSV